MEYLIIVIFRLIMNMPNSAVKVNAIGFKNRYFQVGNLINSWFDISTFLITTGYLKKVIALLNAFHNNNEKMEEVVFEKLKNLLMCTFQYISREQTSHEKERIKYLIKSGGFDFM